MSFSDPRSQYMSSSQSYAVPGSDAINILPQFSSETDDQTPDFDQNPAPFKRARNSEERQSNPSTFPRTIPTNAPINKGPNINNNNNIFFKTRPCAKFKIGACRNGENCNFAHGIEDIRQPPPNWQEMVGLRGGAGGEEDHHHHHNNRGSWDDDQKIIHRMKICKKFYNGEECPYGDRCNFLHEDPSKYRDDSGRFRESSAISIGTTIANVGPPVAAAAAAVVMMQGGSDGDECNRGVANANVNGGNGSDVLRGVPKSVYWKTKLCNKWDLTGHCPFGDKCHFAHGFPGTPQPDLHKLQAGYGRLESEVSSIASASTKPQICGQDLNATAPTSVGAFNEDAQSKKCLLKWKGLKKINRIYGDWLDDLPLAHNIPSRVES